jgi:hypothetical protein
MWSDRLPGENPSTSRTRTRFTHCAAMPASLTTPVHFSISLLI